MEGEREPKNSSQALNRAAAYIQDQMSSFGLHATQAPFTAQNVPGQSLGEDTFFNVIGTGVHFKQHNALLLIGAHYDTVADSPGADDNASSLAVLLEVARVLSKMQGRLTPQFVAFSLEERGFIGSTAYLESLEQNKTPISGAIILECVGYTDLNPGSQHTPPGLPFALPDVGDFIGLLGNEAAKPIQTAFESAVDAYTPDLPKISLLVPGNSAALPDARRSDHVPFWDKGYPAIMLTDTANFRNPHYHQGSDRIETLDLDFIVKVAKAVAATVIHLAELETIETP